MGTNDGGPSGAGHDGLTLLDGAMGSVLRARGVDVPDHETSVWSAAALLSAPDAVETLHSDYIAAGADVITVNNYAVTPKSLARVGMAGRVEELTLTACRLARQAADRFGGEVLVAGSLPPLDISYRPDLVGDHDDLLTVYRRLVGVMAPHVDLFICETMTTATEARAACRAASEVKVPVWVSWTLEEETVCLRGGETIDGAVAALAEFPVEAFLINCSSGEAVSQGVRRLADATDTVIGAYANPFRREPRPGCYSSANPDFLDRQAYADLAEQWFRSGARILGGCCGTDPSYIAELRKSFRES